MDGLMVEGERVIDLDDGRLVQASRELSTRLDQLDSEKQQWTQSLPLNCDSDVPITFTKVGNHTGVFSFSNRQNNFQQPVCCQVVVF